jgi:hypothetical protein
MPQLLYPWERTPGTHWADPSVCLDIGVEEILAPAVNQTLVIQPVACHYTD